MHRSPSTLSAFTMIGLLVLLAILPGHLAVAQDIDESPYVKLSTLGRGAVRSAAWSPAGDLLAVGGVKGIWLYSPELDDVGLLQGHQKAVYGIAFSPDGSQIASVSHDMSLRIWDVISQSEQVTVEMAHEDLVVGVAWSPDGATIATSGYDQLIRLWNAATGAFIRDVVGHEGWVIDIAYSADGKQLASTGFDRTVRLWNTSAWENTHTVVIPGYGRQLQWNPLTGAIDTLVELESGAFSQVAVQDGDNGAGSLDQVRVFAEGVDDLAVHHDAQRAVHINWDGSVQVFDMLSGLRIAEQAEHMDWIIALDWRADGLHVATTDGRIRTWEPGRAELAEVAKGTLESTSFAIRPDGLIHAFAGTDGVTLTDAVTGEVRVVLPGAANAAVFSPDGTQLAIANRNGTITIWGKE